MNEMVMNEWFMLVKRAHLLVMNFYLGRGFWTISC